MKCRRDIILLVVAALLAQKSNAQLPTDAKKTKSPFSLDIFGTVPIQKCGWGMGLNVFSPSLKLSDNIEMRIGGGLYFSSLLRRTINNVPLDAPQTGDATVNLTNNVYGLDAIARFSLPYSKPVIPYIDFFAGQRGFWANMDIVPNHQVYGYQKSTSQNLSSMNQTNYGITLGVMASISQSLKFNAGLMYSYSPNDGQVVDVDQARLESGSVMAGNMATPHGMLIAKVGFTILLKPSGNCSSGSCRPRNTCGSSRSYFGGSGTRSSVRFNFRPRT